MSRSLVLVPMLLVLITWGLCSAAVAADQQPRTKELNLALTTETSALAFKLPALPQVPGLELPDLSELTAPRRVLEADALYPSRPTPPLYVTVPADLGLPQNRLMLELPETPETPEAAEVPEPVEEPAEEPQGKFEHTTLVYWHPDVARGPITRSVSVDLDEQWSDMERLQGIAGIGTGTGVALEDMGTRAFGSASEFPNTGVGRGAYVLNTGGTASLDGFLPPVKVSQPEDFQAVEPEEGIRLKWEPITGAQGIIVHAWGMKGEEAGKSTEIIWVSTLTEPPERVYHRYEQETTIADDLEKGILLPGDTTRCVVPPGVLKDVTVLTVTVTAVGRDYFSTADGITVRGKIRSVWTATKMPGEGTLPPGMVPAPEEEAEEGDVE